MTELPIRIRLLNPAAVAPAYAHPGDAGADLCIADDVHLEPGHRSLVGTGVALEIPDGYVGLVHPRSGLAHRHGISIVNAPGTIDSGYRGEVKINLINTDQDHAVTLQRGERVAQLLILPVQRAAFTVVDELSASERADGGHGSTGTRALQPQSNVKEQ